MKDLDNIPAMMAEIGERARAASAGSVISLATFTFLTAPAGAGLQTTSRDGGSGAPSRTPLTSTVSILLAPVNQSNRVERPGWA